MPEFRTIKEVEAELAKYVPIIKKITGKDITLQRMKPLMRRLGNPERKLKIIHVAGTSGKTSTSYYLAAMLPGKVGLTVSPHIDSLTERVQIDGNPLDKNTFSREFGRFMGLIEGLDPEPSYFELVVAFAYWYFAKAEVDWVVVETGLGGTHDATNIAQAPDKICVITDIGFDHMHILGHTLPDITAQKAGIIHRGNPVYMYKQAPEVTEIFERRAQDIGAKLTLFDQDELTERLTSSGLNKLPLYQQRNWLLARAVCDAQEIAVDESKIKHSLELQVPGRMDIHVYKRKTIVMDGAHNEQKMTTFVESFKAKFPDKNATVLLALKEGKEYQAVLPLLKHLTDRLIITTFDVIQDLPAKSIGPKIIAQAAKDLGFEKVEIITDPHQALKKMLDDESEMFVITGSFYLLSVVRPRILSS